MSARWMRIRDARWTPKVNVLLVACACGNMIEHRADRWIVWCGKCGDRSHLSNLRQQYVEEHSGLSYECPWCKAVVQSYDVFLKSHDCPGYEAWRRQNFR